MLTETQKNLVAGIAEEDNMYRVSSVIFHVPPGGEIDADLITATMEVEGVYTGIISKRTNQPILDTYGRGPMGLGTMAELAQYSSDPKNFQIAYKQFFVEMQYVLSARLDKGVA